MRQLILYFQHKTPELRKARRSWYNQFMRLNKIIQRDYTSFSLYYQIKLPLDLEISIPSDDPVRLVSAFVEEMDLSELYKTYGRIRKNQATPRQMLKLVIYAAMNRIYSSRDIRKACKRDINFMYLLEGMPAPDHATIARFISLHFSACAKTSACPNVRSALSSWVRFRGRPFLLMAPRSNLRPINIHLYGNGLLQKIRPGYTQNCLLLWLNVKNSME